jgi:hypothetical protein
MLALRASFLKNSTLRLLNAIVTLTLSSRKGVDAAYVVARCWR